MRTFKNSIKFTLIPKDSSKTTPVLQTGHFNLVGIT